MTLDEWLQANPMPIRRFADRAGIRHSTILRLLKRKSHPKPGTIEAIVRATNNEVSASSVMSLSRAAN